MYLFRSPSPIVFFPPTVKSVVGRRQLHRGQQQHLLHFLDHIVLLVCRHTSRQNGPPWKRNGEGTGDRHGLLYGGREFDIAGSGRLSRSLALVGRMVFPQYSLNSSRYLRRASSGVRRFKKPLLPLFFPSSSLSIPLTSSSHLLCARKREK